jgi:hypothetical protein
MFHTRCIYTIERKQAISLGVLLLRGNIFFVCLEMVVSCVDMSRDSTALFFEVGGY